MQLIYTFLINENPIIENNLSLGSVMLTILDLIWVKKSQSTGGKLFLKILVPV